MLVCPWMVNPFGNPHPSSPMVTRNPFSVCSRLMFTFPRVSSANPCSKELQVISAMTSAKLMETDPGMKRGAPVTVMQNRSESPHILVLTCCDTRLASSTASTCSSVASESISCAIAMERRRPAASTKTLLASSEGQRRMCKRISDSTVCRLFFTRWCTSWIRASFTRISRASSCSRPSAAGSLGSVFFSTVSLLRFTHASADDCRKEVFRVGFSTVSKWFVFDA